MLICYVWADVFCNPQIRLRHPVTLTGIDKLKSTDSLTLESLLVIKYRIVIQQIIQSLHLIQVSTIKSFMYSIV